MDHVNVNIFEVIDLNGNEFYLSQFTLQENSHFAWAKNECKIEKTDAKRTQHAKSGWTHIRRLIIIRFCGFFRM